jgi:hypothetical protein
MRANFFDIPLPVLPRKELNLPTFGKVVLEKMDTAGTMRYEDLGKEKFAQWGPEGEFPFMVDERYILVTETYAYSIAGLCVMQKQDEPYGFEELLRSSVVCEDEYNLLVVAANELNKAVAPDPKVAQPKQSSGTPEEA